ncbi:TPA: hypothetical protein ACYLN4_000918 [Burkholderia lata]
MSFTAQLLSTALAAMHFALVPIVTLELSAMREAASGNDVA